MQHLMSALPPIATAKADMPQMVMSALPPKADMCGAFIHVCFGPEADMRQWSSLLCALLCFLRRASSPIRLRPLCPLLENGPLKNHSLIDDPGIPAPGVIRIEIHQIETVPTEDPNEIGRRRSHY